MNRVRTRIVNGVSRGTGEDGLTMLELLIVLVVIGVLVAIAIPSVLGQRNRASDAAAKANVRIAIPSLRAYHGDHGTYAGMTIPGLRATYDAGLDASLSLGALTDSSYCLQSTVSGRTWRQNGPAGLVEQASC